MTGYIKGWSSSSPTWSGDSALTAPRSRFASHVLGAEGPPTLILYVPILLLSPSKTPSAFLVLTHSSSDSCSVSGPLTAPSLDFKVKDRYEGSMCLNCLLGPKTTLHVL